MGNKKGQKAITDSSKAPYKRNLAHLLNLAKAWSGGERSLARVWAARIVGSIDGRFGGKMRGHGCT
jgi:hypothetical protein